MKVSWYMLCRACGNEMIAFEYCSDCNEAIQGKCSVCDRQNEKSVHTHCNQGEPWKDKFSSVLSSWDGRLWY